MSTHHDLKKSSLSSGGLSLKRGKYLYRKPQETFHYISFFFFFSGFSCLIMRTFIISSFVAKEAFSFLWSYLDTMGEIKVLGQKSQHYRERRNQKKDAGNQYFPLRCFFKNLNIYIIILIFVSLCIVQCIKQRGHQTEVALMQWQPI